MRGERRGFLLDRGLLGHGRCSGRGLVPLDRLRVLVGNSRSDVLVVQLAQNWHRQRLTDGLDGAGDRRVLLQ
jgi:hypothetical protein